jgi:hypothetical protein
MKIYNKLPGKFITYWNAEDKLDAKGKPERPLAKFEIEGSKQSPDLPPGLANHLLTTEKKRFTADIAAIAAEQKLRDERAAALTKVGELEAFVGDIKALMAAAGSKGNPVAAQAAATQLDELLAQFRPGAVVPTVAADPAPVVPAEPAPAAPSQVAAEQTEFESKKKRR